MICTQKPLRLHQEYYAKIKDRCIAKPETYEDRVMPCGAMRYGAIFVGFVRVPLLGPPSL